MVVAVVGLGLIGGSLALALGARGFDSDPAVRARARARGIDVADTLGEAVRGSTVAVAAVPTDATPEVLHALAAAERRGVLTDVASVKAPVLRAAAELPEGVRLVSGHPMAGSTARGIEAADPHLFRDRTWLLVPTARSDAEAMSLVGDLVRAAGARPLVVSGARHDALMTWVSHLPLAVAAALARTAARRAGAGLEDAAGPGFVDATRLAATPRALALELALADPDALADALDTLREELAAYAGALRAHDRDALSTLLEDAAAARRQLDAIREESASK